MAFGMKMKKVKFKNKYTLESLYEAIKDTEFAAGKPSLTDHGMAKIITFPALDSRNQVQIISASLKKDSDAFRVMKGEEAGLGNLAFNTVVDGLTDGMAGLKGSFGKNAKNIEKLVEETAKQLGEMGL